MRKQENSVFGGLMRKEGLSVRSRLLAIAGALAVVAMLGSIPAQANMIISVTPASVAAGTTGASFNVDIQNTGGSAQNIDAFSIGLSVSTSNFTFTGGNETTTDAYIFAGDSFDVINSFPYTSVPPPTGQTLEASDLSNSGAGTNVAAGATLGLGNIIFNLAGATPPGPITITVISTCLTANSCTSLSDSAGDNVAFSVTNGTVTVTGVTTPEPST